MTLLERKGMFSENFLMKLNALGEGEIHFSPQSLRDNEI